ncbi:hypothetical protein SASC598J21_002450, partial [Snodgrassella alvi SCGC AB-598-J21]
MGTTHRLNVGKPFSNQLIGKLKKATCNTKEWVFLDGSIIRAHQHSTGRS